MQCKQRPEKLDTGTAEPTHSRVLVTPTEATNDLLEIAMRKLRRHNPPTKIRIRFGQKIDELKSKAFLKYLRH